MFEYWFFLLFPFFFIKQKTAYEMRISDWSSDVCSSDLWLMAIYLDHSGNVARCVSAIEGGKGKAFLPIRTIVQEALLHGYDRFLLLHNHPSGDPRPSRTDLQATRLLCRTARTL